ncbi:hypothetical protein AWB75_05050 [Caballeronia catudaia]|uniref:Zinc-ribbon domain-containing protein n=2 Tax=Caballeronia catudaia TaxID=1777136 RepID=A0A158CF75_9BURK|nr:hypothetical protein AWB75_05050 [Caballeronia catudaia]
MVYRKTIADMHALAARKNGQCLSQEYRGMEAKMLWRCESGHEWQAIPERIQWGSWCPQCAREKMRDTIEHMNEIARERGGRCLSSAYVNSDTPLLWECAKGHQWKARPGSIRGPKPSWCPVCAKERIRKETLAWAQGLARKHGGECISNEYKGTTVPLEWRCSEGHTWTAVPFYIARGQWCRLCYIESQRFSLADAQALAAKHNGRCVSKRYTDAKSPLLWECDKGHRWGAPLHNIHRSWCAECSFERKRTGIEKMHEIAAGYGGKCLSDDYTNQSALLRWQCEKGHEWLAKPMKIMIGHWCRTCAIERTRLGIEKMREIAAARAGRCLSDSYVNTITPLQWECCDGHIWSAKPDSVRRGTWCPNCAVLARTKKRTKRERYDFEGK